jgi:hypothetical protein
MKKNLPMYIFLAFALIGGVYFAGYFLGKVSFLIFN